MTSNFKCWTSDFHYVYDKNGRRLLQFTRSWSLTHPLAGEMGDSIEHCIAYKDYHGVLKWNPPLNYMPGGRRKQLHSMTIPLYNHILESLRKSKFLEKIEVPVDPGKKAGEKPDPDMPERIDVL